MKLRDEEITGSLNIPEGAAITYAEPAVLCRVKNAAFFYEKPPLHEASQYNIAMQIDEINDLQENVKKFLLRYTTIKDQVEEIIIAITKLEANTEVLAHAFEYFPTDFSRKKIKHPFLMKVATFKKAVSRDTEDFISETLVLDKIGYMYIDDLIIEPVNELPQKIFANLPEKKILGPSLLGSSTFLAVLNAILAIDDEKHNHSATHFISSMMKQQQDGTIIVRLYDASTLEPHYLKIENNISDKKNILHHPSPWLFALEKAYAVMANKKLENKMSSITLNNEADHFDRHLFLAMQNNHHSADTAFRILTGNSAQTINIDTHCAAMHLFNAETQGILLGKITCFLHDKIFLNKTLHAYLQKLAFINAFDKMENIILNIANRLQLNGRNFLDKMIVQNEIYLAFGKDKNLILKFAIYLFILNYYFPTLKRNYDDITNCILHTRQNMLDLLTQLECLNPSPPKVVINCLMHYFTATSEKQGKIFYRLPGELLSGEYTESDYTLYQNIKQILQRQSIMTAQSSNLFINKDDSYLLIEDVYTVLKVFELDVDQQKILYITLRNPWTSNEYANDRTFQPQTHLSSQGLSEFSIDIAEFSRHFNTYTIGKIKSNEELKNEFETQQKHLDTNENDAFATPFEITSDDERDQLLRIFLAKSSTYLTRYFDSQNNLGICELSRFIGDRILFLERSLFTSTNAQHSLNELNMHNAFFRHLNLYIQNRLGAIKDQTFTMIDQKNLEKAVDLRHSFTATTTNKQNLIFKLLHHSPKEINACLAVQSINDLYEMIRYLEKSINKKKINLRVQQYKEAKKIWYRHLEAERMLSKIVRESFTTRLLASATYVTIKANADTYFYQTFRRKKFKIFKYHLKKYFKRSTLEDQAIEMYKYHLKYKAGFRKELLSKLNHVRNIIKFAKEYLAGAHYDDAIAPNYERLSSLLANSIGIKAKHISSFELSNEGDIYKIVVTTTQEEKKALDVPKEVIENYAIAQYNFKQALLYELKISGHKLEELATDYINTAQGQERIIRVINPPKNAKITSYRLTKNRSGYTLTLNVNQRFENRSWSNDWVEEYAIAQFKLNRLRVINSGLMHF